MCCNHSILARSTNERETEKQNKTEMLSFRKETISLLAVCATLEEGVLLPVLYSKCVSVKQPCCEVHTWLNTKTTVGSSRNPEDSNALSSILFVKQLEGIKGGPTMNKIKKKKKCSERIGIKCWLETTEDD